jgi:MerR family transcriptional regulator, repressor of the yfmOP operon
MNESQVVQKVERELRGETFLKIGEVADLTGLTQRAIRYYEEFGLLPSPTRTQGDYRLFSVVDIARLEEIVRLRSLLGFSLAEIKQMVESEEARSQLRAEYKATEDIRTRLLKLAEATGVTERQLALLERKLAQMMQLRNDLTARLARYEQKRLELEIMTFEMMTPGEGAR